MAASELAKLFSLMWYFLMTFGKARGCFLSMKQPTGSYGGSFVAPLDGEVPPFGQVCNITIPMIINRE